jgi:hypothetical protein
MEAFRTLSPTDPAVGDTSHLIKQRRKIRPTLVQAGGERYVDILCHLDGRYLKQIFSLLCSDVGSSRVLYRGANIPLHLLTKGTQ